MFVVIDSGTTNSRLYLVDDCDQIIASAEKKVGVRDTSITGSADTLRNGLTELFFELMETAQIDPKNVRFAIASGMITSEIGLLELPHLVAPVGVEELSGQICKCTDPAVLPLPCPVYFVRGIRNHYREDARVADLCDIDFMRGEEVQCVGILAQLKPELPCTIVVLSSHTKIIYCNESGQIVLSKTTLSGQLREALIASTNIGASLADRSEETPSDDADAALIDTAYACVTRDGLTRSLLMPRFMQVLLKTSAHQRRIFTDALIASDDMKAFAAMRAEGHLADTIILFGHESRCRIYERLLREKLGVTGQIRSISEKQTIGELTVRGVIAVAKKLIEKENETCFE